MVLSCSRDREGFTFLEIFWNLFRHSFYSKNFESDLNNNVETFDVDKY